MIFKPYLHQNALGKGFLSWEENVTFEGLSPPTMYGALLMNWCLKIPIKGKTKVRRHFLKA